MREITSLQNPQIKGVALLQRDARERRERGLFCVEGAREIERALEAGFGARTLFIEQGKPLEERLLGLARRAGAELIIVRREAMEKMAKRQHPSGVLAVLEARRRTLEGLVVHPTSLFVVCSGLEKPGNVGAILRTADGAGVDAVFIDDEGFDLYNPHAVHASTGAIFHVPVVCIGGEELRAWFRHHGVGVLALSPEGVDVYQGNRFVGGPKALVLGAEAEGLGDAWRAAAGGSVAIPMQGRADSLNVSVAAAIVIFEARRQQRMG